MVLGEETGIKLPRIEPELRVCPWREKDVGSYPRVPFCVYNLRLIYIEVYSLYSKHSDEKANFCLNYPT